MKIRKYVKEDKKTFKNYFNLSPENGIGGYLAIDDSNTLMGLILFNKTKDTNEILEIYVCYGHLFEQVARRLLDKALTEFGESVIIEFTVHEDFLSLQKFLRSMGFKARKVLRNYYISSDAFYFTLER